MGYGINKQNKSLNRQHQLPANLAAMVFGVYLPLRQLTGLTGNRPQLVSNMSMRLLGKNLSLTKLTLAIRFILSYKDKAKKILKMFPIHRTVSVFVNPDNYAKSVLLKGPGANRVVSIAIGTLFGCNWSSYKDKF